MADFEPLSISDWRNGQFTAREDLVSPSETWKSVSNFRLNRGRLEVRGGYSLLGTLYPQVRQQIFAGTAGTTVISGTLSQIPVHPTEAAPSTYTVTWWDGGAGAPSGKIATADAAGVITGANVSSGSITYSTGVFTFTYTVNATNDVRANFEWERGLAVTGLLDHFQNSGVEHLLACDTKRVYKWNSAEERFYDLLGADLFTATEYDYFWMLPWNDNVLLSNGVNAVYEYVPAGTVTEVPTEFDAGSGGNDLDNAVCLIRHRGRLIAFGTTENGTRFPQRARRSSIGNYAVWVSTDFAEAPTNQAIVSAGVLGDNIIVFFDGGEAWIHRYTGETAAPYEWIKHSGYRGSSGTFSVTDIEGGLVTVGTHGLVATDGRTMSEIDNAIPDYQRLMQIDKLDRSYGLTVTQEDAVWLSHVLAGNTAPGAIVVWNFRENAWSVYEIGLRVFDFFRQTTTYTHDSSPSAVTYDSQPASFPTSYDDVLGQSGVPFIVGGDGAARVFLFDDSASDNGTSFTARARTQQIAPYPGQQTRLGWVEVIGDAAAMKTGTLRFYRDAKPASYYSASFSLEGGAGDTKIRKRIRVNQRAMFHQIELEVPSIPGWGLDALILWMQPDGDTREF